MGRYIGIDLGTTYSVVACINAQGQAEVIPNEHGGLVTPSVVYVSPGGVAVGEEAVEQQEAGNRNVAAFFKRNIDDTYFLFTAYEREYSAVDLSSLVLSYLKKQAEAFLGETVTHAVITVPAYFVHGQRVATKTAAEQAGLTVLKIINEPTAAALAYGVRASRSQEKQIFLVYDLGGGTFDVSLVASTETDLVVLGTTGDFHLGGKDWDDRLLNYLAARFQDEFQTELLGNDIHALRVQCENLKRSLSVRQQASIRVQAGGYAAMYTVTRELFAELTRDLMERTQLLTEEVLREARLDWRDLSGVLPVGGSTRMPMVTDYIQRMSGRPPMTGINPDEAVGLGAAIQAAMEMEEQTGLLLSGTSAPLYHLPGRKKTVDVIAHSLGLIAESSDRSSYVNSILIRKNQPIPSTVMRPYQLRVRCSAQAKLEVFLTQGESSNPQECFYLGQYIFTGFSRQSTRERLATIDITYEYDKNGIVHISAIEQATGQPLNLAAYPVPADIPERFTESPLAVQQREPLTVYLAFDVSGSMHTPSRKGKPIEQAMRAAEQFVRKCDPQHTSIGLIAFSRETRIEQIATNDQAQILQAIQRLPYVETGITNEGDPFDTLYACLSDTPGLRYAVVLADGLWVHQYHAIQRAKRCQEEGCIEVIAVGFGSADRAFLNQIASSPEQSFFTQLDKLVETFTTIAQEIRQPGEKRGLL